jgi:hypothetical protein
MAALEKLVRFLFLSLPWLVEASCYAVVVPFFLGLELISPGTRGLAFLCILIVGSYSDRKIWQSYTRVAIEGRASRPVAKLEQALPPIMFSAVASFLFNLLSFAALPKLIIIATVISVAKYLLFELQWMSLKR